MVKSLFPPIYVAHDKKDVTIDDDAGDDTYRLMESLLVYNIDYQISIEMLFLKLH